MMCWKDRWYCGEAANCANAEGCSRALPDAEALQAEHEGIPVCYAHGGCEKYKPKEKTMKKRTVEESEKLTKKVAEGKYEIRFRVPGDKSRVWTTHRVSGTREGAEASFVGKLESAVRLAFDGKLEPRGLKMQLVWTGERPDKKDNIVLVDLEVENLSKGQPEDVSVVARWVGGFEAEFYKLCAAVKVVRGVMANLDSEASAVQTEAPEPAALPPVEVEAPGESADKIIKMCNSVKVMLLEKNRKYGDSALEPKRVFSKADPVEQLRIRIDDKLSRIQNMQADEDEDVYKDLVGYLILLMIAIKDRK